MQNKLDHLGLHQIDLTRARCWKPAASISCRLLEALALPGDIAASANPKSSTGRLDIFTRVIADRARAFDQVEPAIGGPLYLEVSPRTFPIVVRTGSRLSQIRFRRGHARLDDDARARLQQRDSGLGAGAVHRRTGRCPSI